MRKSLQRHLPFSMIMLVALVVSCGGSSSSLRTQKQEPSTGKSLDVTTVSHPVAAMPTVAPSVIASRSFLVTSAMIANAQSAFLGTAPANSHPPVPSSLTGSLDSFDSGTGSKFDACIADATKPTLPTSSCTKKGQVGNWTYLYSNPDFWELRVARLITLFTFSSLIDTDNKDKWTKEAHDGALAAAGFSYWGYPPCPNNDLGVCSKLAATCKNFDGTYMPITEFSDLASAELLFGVSFAVNWIPMTSDEQYSILRSLQKHGRAMYCRATTVGAQPTSQMMNNHYWITNAGLAAAGYMLQKDPALRAEGKAWVEVAKKNYARFLQKLWPDGGDHEGPGYWDYGVAWTMLFFDLVNSQENCNFLPLVANDPHLCTVPAGFKAADFSNAQKWYERTAHYRISQMTPMTATTVAESSLPANFLVHQPVLLADGSTAPVKGPTSRSFRTDDVDAYRQSSPEPSSLRRLAGVYKIPEAQQAAADMEQALGGMGGIDLWRDFMWFEPKQIAQSASAQNLLFSDLGLASDRSNWTPSADTSLVNFSYGAPLPKHFNKYSCDLEVGAGHAHPAAGTFSVSLTSGHAGLGMYLIRNSGYASKYTKFENTLTVDGLGQYGENDSWLRWNDGTLGNGACNGHTAFRFRAGGQAANLPGIVVTSADLAGVYPSERGIEQFNRTLVYFKKGTLLVIDHIVPTSDSKAKKLELHFHSDQPASGSGYLWQWTQEIKSLSKTAVAGDAMSFRFESVVPSDKVKYGAEFTGFDTTAVKDRFVNPNGLETFEEDGLILTRPVKIGGKSAAWDHIAAISWSLSATSPVDVNIVSSKDAQHHVIAVGADQYDLDLGATDAADFIQPHKVGL